MVWIIEGYCVYGQSLRPAVNKNVDRNLMAGMPASSTRRGLQMILCLRFPLKHLELVLR
jgi:hypothetical protein